MKYVKKKNLCFVVVSYHGYNFFLLINEEEKTNKFRLNRVLSSVGQFSAENYVLISIYYFFIFFLSLTVDCLVKKKSSQY